MTRFNVIANNPAKNQGYGVKVTKEKLIKDISNDFSAVQTLVNTCNLHQVDYEHFEDVLENFIDDYKTF